jgi:hypothetical protein
MYIFNRTSDGNGSWYVVKRGGDFRFSQRASDTLGGGGGVAGGTVDTATIDTSADQTLTITAQKATGTETVTFLGVSVLLQRFV